MVTIYIFALIYAHYRKVCQYWKRFSWKHWFQQVIQFSFIHVHGQCSVGQLLDDPLCSHKLHSLLPSHHDISYNLRDFSIYQPLLCHTNRYCNRYIPYCVKKNFNLLCYYDFNLNMIYMLTIVFYYMYANQLYIL